MFWAPLCPSSGVTPYKRDTWPTDRNHQALHCKKPTKNTHTRPPRHSTHLITNLDNTRHLILRTQILPNLRITFYIFTAQDTTGSNHCIILLSSWWWAQWCPKHFEQAIRSAIKTSVASSWHFISTYTAFQLAGKMFTHKCDTGNLSALIQCWNIVQQIERDCFSVAKSRSIYIRRWHFWLY